MYEKRERERKGKGQTGKYEEKRKERSLGRVNILNTV